MRSLFVSAALCLLAGATIAQAAAAPGDLEARRKALDSLIKEHWEYNLDVNPEFASILGDKRYTKRWSDHSPQAIEANSRLAEFKTRFESTSRRVPEQEALMKTPPSAI